MMRLISVSLALTLAIFPGFGFGQTGAVSQMRIGVIGSGNIGGTVGALWVKAGHRVLFSSRHPEQLKKLVDDLGPLAGAGSVKEALNFGDVIFIAVPYGAYPQIGRDHTGAFRNKIVLDAGNAVTGRDGEIVAEAAAQGIGITSAKYLAGARIVRAFNTLNYRTLAREANRAGSRLAIPIAGDDKEALTVASTLVRDAGFDSVVVGSLQDAKHFARGAALYGLEMNADEMQQRVKRLK
jgi:predicted dinucleotide-binding enzyme